MKQNVKEKFYSNVYSNVTKKWPLHDLFINKYARAQPSPLHTIYHLTRKYAK